MSETDVRIAVGPLRLLLVVVSLVSVMWAGVYGIVRLVVENENSLRTASILAQVDAKIARHSVRPHAAALEQAREIAERVATIDRDVQLKFLKEVQGLTAQNSTMQVKQAGFSADITWVKTRQIQNDAKLDKILAKLGHREK